MHRELTEDERQDLLADLAAAEAIIEAALADAAPDLEAFRSLIAAFFREFAKPPYTRRPNLGLQLAADGCLLAVRPEWSKDRSALDCDKVLVECTADAYQASLRLEPGRPPRPWKYHTTNAEATVDRLIRAARAFLSDPRRAFTGGQDRCGICRHRLTDEVSRTRGVGPECVEKWRWLIRRAAVTAEERAGQQTTAGSVPPRRGRDRWVEQAAELFGE